MLGQCFIESVVEATAPWLLDWLGNLVGLLAHISPRRARDRAAELWHTAPPERLVSSMEREGMEMTVEKNRSRQVPQPRSSLNTEGTEAR